MVSLHLLPWVLGCPFRGVGVPRSLDDKKDVSRLPRNTPPQGTSKQGGGEGRERDWARPQPTGGSLGPGRRLGPAAPLSRSPHRA
jgi:hypothetical protein